MSLNPYVAILTAFESVGGLSRNHTPHATTWVLHIALTARNQMDMSVANCLSGSVPMFMPMLKPITDGSFFMISARSPTSG